jgi:hypothetical protein
MCRSAFALYAAGRHNRKEIPVGRLLLIAAAIGIVLAVAVGFLVNDLMSGSGNNLPAHATLYNYGTR